MTKEQTPGVEQAGSDSLLAQARGLAEVGYQERTYYDHRITGAGENKKTTWHSFVTLSPGDVVATTVRPLSFHHGVGDIDGNLMYSVAVEEATRPSGVHERTEVYLFQVPEDHVVLQGILAIPNHERVVGSERVSAYRGASPAAYQAAVEMGFVHRLTTDTE